MRSGHLGSRFHSPPPTEEVPSWLGAVCFFRVSGQDVRRLGFTVCVSGFCVCFCGLWGLAFLGFTFLGGFKSDGFRALICF